MRNFIVINKKLAEAQYIEIWACWLDDSGCSRREPFYPIILRLPDYNIGMKYEQAAKVFRVDCDIPNSSSSHLQVIQSDPT